MYQHVNAENRINLNRSLAIAVALVVHIGALGFLMAPIRINGASVEKPRDDLSVFWQEPRILPPPPPPPPQPVRIERVRATTPVAPRPVVPVPVPETTVAAAVSEAPVIDSEPALFDPEPIGAPASGFHDMASVEILQSAPPKYPVAEIRRRHQGEVLLLLHIDADGRPVEVEVARSSGYSALDRSAIDSVLKRWRFRPAVVNGQTVAGRAYLPVRFTLSR